MGGFDGNSMAGEFGDAPEAHELCKITIGKAMMQVSS